VKRRDDGAAAVEMAIVLPLLMVLVFGIIDFGRMLNAQMTVTAAAREGARWEAIGGPALAGTSVATRVNTAAAGLTPVVTAVVQTCTPTSAMTANAEVRVTHTFTFITPIGGLTGSGLLSGTKNLTGRGVMRCGG
jgi:Flp pilus assembly protein TadG